jgi:hypothetical protein
VDLIPNEFRRQVALREQLRRGLVACIVLLASVLLGRVALQTLLQKETAAVAHLQTQEQQLLKNQQRTAELQQRQQMTEQQLAALDQLRERNGVGRFLRAVDVAYNEGIWLERVNYVRQRASPTGATSQTASDASNAPLQISQGAEVTGHAVTHTLLAEFMRELGAQPGVADLRLISTSSRDYTSVQVVDFKLILKLEGGPQGGP